jgi:DNA-binding protein YbaB
MNDVHDPDDNDDDHDDHGGELADLGGLELPDLSALPDLGSMLGGLAQVQQIQQQAFEGVAGGGAVRIRASGRMEVESVTIDPAVLDPPDADLLADLVTAALHDLTGRIADAQKAAMGPLGDILGS